MTDKPDLDHLRQWIGRTHRSLRHRYRATGEGPARDAVPWRSASPSRATPRHSPCIGAWRSRCSRCRSWARTAIPPAAASCRRCRCRGGCGPAANSNSSTALRVGDEAKRTSRIADVTMKTGSTGILCFVSVEHLVTTSRGIAIRERQDIVYRDMSTAPQAAPAQTRIPAADCKTPRKPHGRSRAAVSLFGADLQRPPHPLRPRLCHQGRGLSRPDLPRPDAGELYCGIGGQAAWRQSRRRNSAIAACSRCSKAASSASMPTTTDSRHGAMDREFGGPADHEGHRDVVKCPVIASEAKQSMPHVEHWMASSRSLSSGPPKAGPVGSSQ